MTLVTLRAGSRGFIVWIGLLLAHFVPFDVKTEPDEAQSESKFIRIIEMFLCTAAFVGCQSSP